MSINLIVTLSNIFGVSALCRSYNKSKLEFGIILSSIIGSILQHLSDLKHGQQGLLFLQYSKQLLWLDRSTAILAASYFSIKMYKNNLLFTKQTLIKAFVGLTFMAVSENINLGLNVFALTHSVWHFFAYSLLNDAV